MNRPCPFFLLLMLLCWMGFAPWARAQSPVQVEAATDREVWNVHAQSTWVGQQKGAVHSPYSGANSLRAEAEDSYSFTFTTFLGWRPWQGSEIYFNPEWAKGRPLSNMAGLGGFTNGELSRVSGENLTYYRARLFWRQTWESEGSSQTLASGPNQLAGVQSSRRWVLTAGQVSVLDLFDTNLYSHDARTQFLNWSLMTHGAYDYAADSRGYSYGVALEGFFDDWVLRLGRFAQPLEPNQLALDDRLLQHYGDQLEIEHAHTLGGQAGKWRLLVFHNRALMSRFEDANQWGAQQHLAPDLNAVRTSTQDKWGWGLNWEQALHPNIGVFARASWADGQTETYAFTEIDQSLSAGLVLQGALWHRPQDSWGLGLASNAISAQRQAYLGAGGMGFFIGDGRLSAARENIFESYYSLGLGPYQRLSLDGQHIQNPAYNSARGPVTVWSLRWHAEF